MARANTRTLLPLDTWAAILGISPWEFNQFSFPFPKSAQCKDVIFQFPWQKDHLSREEIAEAIADAERMLADELLYWPAPQYIVGEVVQYPQPYPRDHYGYGGDIRGALKTVQLKWHKVQSGGVLNRTLIGDTNPIAFSDPDGDGVNDLFTATITVPSGTLADEIGVYFTDTDRNQEPIGEIWRVRPVRVTVSGTTATITGHSTLLVKPDLTLAANAVQLDPAIIANYVTELECYRVFIDDSSTEAQPYQGVAEWKIDPGCSQNCTFQVKELCLGEDIDDIGIVFASFGSPSTWPFHWRDPDRLNVNYVAGHPLENGQMNAELARMVTYLSVSLLASEKCGCDRSNRILAVWRERITRFEDSSVGASAFTRNNTPFPMTVGGQHVWKRVLRMRDIESVSI